MSESIEFEYTKIVDDDVIQSTIRAYSPSHAIELLAKFPVSDSLLEYSHALEKTSFTFHNAYIAVQPVIGSA